MVSDADAMVSSTHLNMLGLPSAPLIDSHEQNYKLSFTHVQDMLVKSQH